MMQESSEALASVEARSVAEAPDAPEVVVAPLRSAGKAWLGYVAGMVALAAAVVAISFDEYWLSLAISGMLFAGLASAWNIIGGFGGQFSLAHSVFFGVGAYSVALLQTRQGWSPWLGLVVGMVLSAVVAALLALPLFRLRGPFFAIGTLALSEVALALATYFDWTGGSRGVLIPFSQQPVSDPRVWAALTFSFLALCLACSLLVARGRLGYYLVAVRDDHDAASAAGANPNRVKTTAFAISAALTGLGGGLFVMYLGFLDPPSFLSAVEIGAFVPLLALIGGIGTVVGPVLGGLVLQPAETYLKGELAGLHAGVSAAIVGALLIIAALFFHQGIWGRLVAGYRKVRERRG